MEHEEEPDYDHFNSLITQIFDKVRETELKEYARMISESVLPRGIDSIIELTTKSLY
jgi:hypothetical protein